MNNGGPNKFFQNSGDGVPTLTATAAGALTTGNAYTMTVSFAE